jgi:hypothetical protein
MAEAPILLVDVDHRGRSSSERLHGAGDIRAAPRKPPASGIADLQLPSGFALKAVDRRFHCDAVLAQSTR